MAQHVLALDQGTTSSRSIVFDESGEIVSSAQEEFEQIFPRPGWVEHDPEAIWETQLRTARAALEGGGLPPDQIAGIGITNQRETALLWNRSTGQAVGNAIVWQDRRTATFCDALKSDAGSISRIRERTGLVVDAYFSASKIRWMLDHIPGARQAARDGELAFGTVDTWLIWKLSGGRLHLTDPSNASRTMLCRIDTAEWDDDLLELFSIPRAILPEIRSSSEIYGHTAPALFGSPIPISGIAGDQQAALFGQACHHSGMAKNTYGTGCFLLMNTGAEKVISRNNLLTTIAWKIDGRITYALEGSVFIAGAAIQWLRDQLGIIRDAAEVETLARTVEDSGGVFFVPAFAGLGAPHWDPFARGTITGLTRGSNKAHLARAALEAIALQTADLLDAMTADSGIELAELRVDGGATRNDLLMQIQADLLEKDVVRSRTSETTALGAACLAGLATGVWSEPEDVGRAWAETARFRPEARPGVPELKRGWQRAVEKSKGWAAE